MGDDHRFVVEQHVEEHYVKFDRLRLMTSAVVLAASLGAKMAVDVSAALLECMNCMCGYVSAACCHPSVCITLHDAAWHGTGQRSVSHRSFLVCL
jgi:hypothetical protein